VSPSCGTFPVLALRPLPRSAGNLVPRDHFKPLSLTIVIADRWPGSNGAAFSRIERDAWLTAPMEFLMGTLAE